MIHIDGQSLEFREGETILERAQRAGIDIPALCRVEWAYPVQSCRLCVVEVSGADTLLPACATCAGEGMTVHTASEAVVRARREILTLLAGSFRHETPLGNQRGKSYLQELFRRYHIPLPHPPSGESGPAEFPTPNIRYHPQKCIVCHRCIAACREVKNIGAIDIRQVEGKSRVVPDRTELCASCGECLQVCPTLALTDAVGPGGWSAWKGQRITTTCGYCGCGCQMDLHLEKGSVLGVSARDHVGVNQGSLCAKGRFGYEFIQSRERLTTPLIRGDDGSFREADWEEALSLAAERLSTLRDRHGPDSLAGLASAKCTNEENYLFQKLMRGVLGTNNVDHCARLCHSSTVAGLASAFGSGAMTNPIRDVLRSRVILVTGSNTTENHPIYANYIIHAVQHQGAKLIVADPRGIGLTRLAHLWLRPRLGTDLAWINGLMHIILQRGWQDQAFIDERTEGFDELASILRGYTPDYVTSVTGIPAEELHRAAELLGTEHPASLFYAMGITQHANGTDKVKVLADLAMLTGNVGVEGGGVNPLRGQNNVQGACDMGALPNVFPGYQPVGESEVRQRFSRVWHCGDLPAEVGLAATQMMPRAREGSLKGMYIMGENPVLSDPDQGHAESALDSLQFLLVQDIFFSETARRADIVLPSASFAEKDGTFTSSERLVQRVRRALSPPGGARPDLDILVHMAAHLGTNWGECKPSGVMEEIASLTPSYGGITHQRLEAGGIPWPCPDREHPGTPRLHEQRFSRGRGVFFPVHHREPMEQASEQYPLLLTTGRVGPHYHTGTMTRQGVGLTRLYPQALAELSPSDADRLGIGDGERVRLTSPRGSVEAVAQVSERSAPGEVFLPFHFHESPANRLTAATLDPVALIPEFKVSAVRVEKAE
ncbi:MAG: formate dehydrogenase subunit alpha [Desulfohalobiaceae bacterium]|nr:formate dehydrogenase subunit alpha [Desulfohalobiaceae bacterium]